MPTTTSPCFLKGKVKQTLREDANVIRHLNCAEEILRAAEVLCPCGTIFTTGVGKSGLSARRLAELLTCIRIKSHFLSPLNLLHGSLGAVSSDDGVIAFSKSGNTSELLSLVPFFKKLAACLISVTAPSSPLAKHSDVVIPLKIEIENNPFQLVQTTSSLAQDAISNALLVALSELRGVEREVLIDTHPGGEVGRRMKCS